MSYGDVQTLVDTSTLRIALRRSAVATDVTAVAFAGVQGAFGGIPVEEFAGSLGRSATPHDAVFVIDKTRGWYNETVPDIGAVLAPHLAGRRVVTLGNSMGGFGALLFAERLNAAAALAVCPQYSIASDLVPFETRWRDFAAAIPVFRYPTCLPARPSAATRIVLAGAGHDADMAHARLIHRRLRTGDAVFALKPCGHDVAQVLKQQGILSAILDAVLTVGGAGNAIAAVLNAGAIDYELWARKGSREASKSG
jgi:pimeloyl-ACP methyl ester carboxylesterase